MSPDSSLGRVETNRVSRLRRRLRQVRRVFVAALVLLSTESLAAEEDFYLLTLSEGGQYVGSHSDPVAKSRSDSSSRLGPFETTVRLDPVAIGDLGWFAGEAVETWHRKMDLFWAALEQDRRMFDRIEGVDLSELSEEGRALTASLRDQWRRTIEPRIRQHAALESYLEDVKVIERLILGLREYRYQGTAVRQQFRGGEWYALTQTPDFVYQVTASAEGWSKEERYPAGGESFGAGGFVRSSKLLVWRFDPKDMARAAELMADWPAIENAIGPQLDREGSTVMSSAELQGRPVYGGNYDWFVSFFREGLDIIMGAAWTLTPHALPERLQFLPTDETVWHQGPAQFLLPLGQPGSPGPIEFQPLTAEDWKPSEQGQEKQPSGGGQAPLKNQYFTIGSFRHAIPPGTPLELPPISSGTLMRFEAAHSPIAEIEFQVEGRDVQTGADNYRDERELDGVYRPWDSVGAIPSPAPLAWQVLPLEQRRLQLNSSTGVQATNFTSPHLTGWYYIQVNCEVPEDALVGELHNHWLTGYGEEFRTQLT